MSRNLDPRILTLVNPLSKGIFLLWLPWRGVGIHSGPNLTTRRSYLFFHLICIHQTSQSKTQKYAHYFLNMGSFMKNLIDMFIVDHACKTMTNADKTESLFRKFAFRANKTMWLPTVPPPPPPSPNIRC